MTLPSVDTIDVGLGKRSYPIYVGLDTLSTFGEVCRNHELGSNLGIISDKNVARYYLRPVENSLKHLDFQVRSVVILPGEKRKSLAQAGKLYGWLLENRFGRDSAIIALGGGMVGDLSGFVASTFQRGVAFIQCPTSLLAQVDSSIGGKTGVNHPFGKNMVGTFYQPRFVFSDVRVLQTLPQREVVCGLGEVIKLSIIQDPSLFEYIDEFLEDILSLKQEVLLRLVRCCGAIKASIVSSDETESMAASGRVVLNLGHTIGHALEAASNYRLKHGEAVLLGLLAEGRLALEQKKFSPSDFEKLRRLIERIPLRNHRSSLRQDQLLHFIAHDKKARKGRVRFVLPRTIGEVYVAEEVGEQDIRKALQYIGTH
ncbi:MAG: 3-dehydroquinate synthase [Bacteroidota bacterium]